MRALKFVSLVFAGSLIVGCGGGQSKGGDSDKSSYEQLQELESNLNAAMNKVVEPIDQVDAMITKFTEVPTKYKLSPADFKAFAGSMMAGAASVPGSVDAKAAADLKSFATDFSSFKAGLMKSPDNVKALLGEVTGALAKVPLLAGKVAAEAALVKNNPFKSAADKAKAAKQVADVKALETKVLAQVKEMQTKVAGLPARAVAAVAKFGSAMKEAGLGSVSAAVATPGSIKDDANNAVKDTGKAVTDSAEKAADAAQGE
jgi:hypothetical protein